MIGLKIEKVTHEWKHRTKVYKFGARWSWRCHCPGCGQGGSRKGWTQQQAFASAFIHATVGGCWCCSPFVVAEPAGGSITGYPLGMRDDETEDDYADRLIELSRAQVLTQVKPVT